MRTFSFFLILIVFLSCSNSNTGVDRQLANADSLVIRYNMPNTDSVIKTVSTTDLNAINKLAGFLNGKEAEQFKCGYDGNLVFYKEGQTLVTAAFKYTEDGCEHILFDSGKETKSVIMNAEAKSFFKNLLEEKGWY